MDEEIHAEISTKMFLFFVTNFVFFSLVIQFDFKWKKLFHENVTGELTTRDSNYRNRTIWPMSVSYVDFETIFREFFAIIIVETNENQRKPMQNLEKKGKINEKC